MARYWTREEELALLQNVGNCGILRLRKDSGKSYSWGIEYRSASAIYSKLRRMGYKGGFTNGVYTLSAIIEETGYSKSQIKRAVKALRQKWKRTSANGSYIITDDQYEEICNWLRVDYWSKYHRLYKCLWCATNEIEHQAYGLCCNCFKIYSNFLNKYKIHRSLEGVKVFIDKLYKEGIILEIEYHKIIDLLSKRKAFPLNLIINRIN